MKTNRTMLTKLPAIILACVLLACGSPMDEQAGNIETQSASLAGTFTGNPAENVTDVRIKIVDADQTNGSSHALPIPNVFPQGIKVLDAKMGVASAGFAFADHCDHNSPEGIIPVINEAFGFNFLNHIMPDMPSAEVPLDLSYCGVETVIAPNTQLSWPLDDYSLFIEFYDTDNQLYRLWHDQPLNIFTLANREINKLLENREISTLYLVFNLVKAIEAIDDQIGFESLETHGNVTEISRVTNGRALRVFFESFAEIEVTTAPQLNETLDVQQGQGSLP